MHGSDDSDNVDSVANRRQSIVDGMVSGQK